MKKILVFICLMFLSTSSYSLNISSYNNLRSEPENEMYSSALHNYITGLYHGLKIAHLLNVVVKEKYDLPTNILIYCVPEGLTLNYENLLQIIDDELEQGDYTGNLVLTHPLVAGLVKTFPCE